MNNYYLKIIIRFAIANSIFAISNGQEFYGRNNANINLEKPQIWRTWDPSFSEGYVPSKTVKFELIISHTEKRPWASVLDFMDLDSKLYKRSRWHRFSLPSMDNRTRFLYSGVIKEVPVSTHKLKTRLEFQDSQGEVIQIIDREKECKRQ